MDRLWILTRSGPESSGRGRIELRPGRAIGYSERTYPWRQKDVPTDGFEPLILPWAGSIGCAFAGTAVPSCAEGCWSGRPVEPAPAAGARCAFGLPTRASDALCSRHRVTPPVWRHPCPIAMIVRDRLLHIYRNTPYGRENLLQAAYFARQLGDLPLAVFVPEHPRVVLRFGVDEVTIFLDKSYLLQPSTARRNVQQIVSHSGAELFFYEPREYAASTLPVLPTDYRFMSCPRAVTEHGSPIGLGHLGPKVRAILRRASFPLLIPAMAFIPWSSVTVLYGGSRLSVGALRVALTLSGAAKLPLRVFTHVGDASVEACEQAIEQQGLAEPFAGADPRWVHWEGGHMQDHLLDIPHDSLVVLGAAGHNLLSEVLFGSKLELVQSHCPNPFLVVGPAWKPWSPNGL